MTMSSIKPLDVLKRFCPKVSQVCRYRSARVVPKVSFGYFSDLIELSSSQIKLSRHGQKFGLPHDWMRLITRDAILNLAAIFGGLPDHQKKILEQFIQRNADPELLDVCDLIEVAEVSKIGVTLSFEVLAFYESARKLSQDKISGKRFTKEVLDRIVTCSVGMGAEKLGQTIGNFFFGVKGSGIGGIVGRSLGTVMASYGTDRLTQVVFGLPKDVGLENAYRFLEIDVNSSNDDISRKYRQLYRRYHQKEAKRLEKLELSMKMIKEARETL